MFSGDDCVGEVDFECYDDDNHGDKGDKVFCVLLDHLPKEISRRCI